MFKILIAFYFLLGHWAVAAPTGIYIHENLFGFSKGFDNSATAVKASTAVYSETGLGYVLGSWFYLGGVFHYSYTNERTTDTAAQTIDHLSTYQFYGPTLGWIGDNWVLLGHYFAFAQQRDNVSSPNFSSYTIDRTGSGFGGLLGYRFVLGWFELGPALSYRSITYINCKNIQSGATGTCDPKINQAEFTPYLSLWFNIL